jgi:hypothetical protein
MLRFPRYGVVFGTTTKALHTTQSIHPILDGMMKSNFLFQMFRNWDPKEIAPLLALIKVGRSVIPTISAVRFADVLFTPDWTIPPPWCLLLDLGILVRTHRTAGCRTFCQVHRVSYFSRCWFQSRWWFCFLGTSVPVFFEVRLGPTKVGPGSTPI